MRKHILTFIIILLVLCLGYGMWLYSESLRTGIDFGRLLKQDLTAEKEALNDMMAKESE
jgi:hypothetical protein